jgi:apolipoprotein N-acyltransferase
LQLASLGGILGLSFWVIMTNVLGLKFLLFPSKRFFSYWFFAAIFPFIYGFCHIARYDAMQGGSNAQNCSVLLLQPGLLPSQKYILQGRKQEFIPIDQQWDLVLQEIALHKEAKVDVIVFPEAAFPFGKDLPVLGFYRVRELFFSAFGEKILPFFEGAKPLLFSNADLLQMLSDYLQTQVLAGLDLSEQGNNYNSAIFFVPGGKRQERYDKRVLLPLAEYIPFQGLQRLSHFYGVQEFFSPGKEAKVFGDFCLAPSICYDELFSSLAREAQAKGAKLFVNLTNDGWYPGRALSEQHFTHGLIRSVENGVASVRACNIGVSAAVDCLGRVASRLEGASGSLLVNVSLGCSKTLYSLWGDVPLICFSFVMSILFFVQSGRNVLSKYFSFFCWSRRPLWWKWLEKNGGK